MSAERRQRPMAASARIASQPYPATEQRIQAWVESLGAPQQRGLGISSTVEAPPPPPPPPMEAQHAGIPALAGWVETDYRFQDALAHALQLPDYSNIVPDIRMKEPWERSTVASTMHTVSMLDWNDEDARSEAVSDGTARLSRNPREERVVAVIPHGEEEEDAGSDYAPSSRSGSVTPPRKATLRKAQRATRRKAKLDEEYDEQDIDIDAVISGEPSGPKHKKRYVSSSTAVDDHSARSSPRESPSPLALPPPRRKGVLRGKVARRASWRPTANFGSRDASDAGGSDSA